jgi:predicted acyltransferase
MAKVNNFSKRIDAIDVLRGFDMFFLVGAGDLLRNFFGGFQSGPLEPVLKQLNHDWLGFTAWDIIMPLFLFTSGLSMPFSFGKFLTQGHTKAQLYVKIFRRFCLLFLFGWLVQGNLLDLKISTFHIYCNTLHAIAFGYLITSVIVLFIRKFKTQLAIAVSMVLAYWACLTFIGGSDFSEQGNLAMRIDIAVLGRFRDGTHYTWVLSSLGFAATVISGYFAGSLLKQEICQTQKLKILTITGVALIAGGLLWTLQMPMIKPIWSPSMILLSSGICFLLLALSFLLTDKLQMKGWWVTGLRIFGMNSIAAYLIHSLTWSFKPTVEHLLRGLEQFTGPFFPTLVSLGGFTILFLILRSMYKQKIFLKI